VYHFGHNFKRCGLFDAYNFLYHLQIKNAVDYVSTAFSLAGAEGFEPSACGFGGFGSTAPKSL
ncbi:MAG: hypothetical protein OSJ61_12105, partial [Lachnospiraceae bacterium]|nr:hypothetical protein [Lachnospiraceae bacterium]